MSCRQGLLVGLKNGAVHKIFIDNRFPILLIKHDGTLFRPHSSYSITPPSF